MPVKTLSVGLETNGKGFMGFLVEAPGAFVRGSTEQEALSKVPAEARSYLRWLGMPAEFSEKVSVVQRHQCGLNIEDGDCEILLDADRGPVDKQEFMLLLDRAVFSGQTFSMLYQSVRLKDWVDPARVRPTFYGETPRTIRETFNHVDRTQYYYLSRTGVQFHEDPTRDLLKTRHYCLRRIKELFEKNGNSRPFDIDNEQWTLKKILRRFIWHDRIHGKAIVRILQKQNANGLIRKYTDPFCFPQ